MLYKCCKYIIFEYKIFIYSNKEINNMKRQITKTSITVTIDKKLSDIMNEDINNKSKYIEWLIYQDLKHKSTNEKIKKIII